MPKKKKLDFESKIISQIKAGKIKMKPKWYFVAGSLLTIVGLAATTVMAIFFINLTLFFLRKQGPGTWRLQVMLETFPWWMPILGVLGIILGVWLLKKYDFSYKNNFWLIIFGFILSVIFAAFTIDFLGLNHTWSHQGPMRRFYQQIEGRNPGFQPKPQQAKGLRRNLYN